MNDLKSHFSKSQAYLKLGDKDEFKGFYIAWESINTKFGKKGYRFTLEREDGSRLFWDTSNSKAINQISDLIDKGLIKGSRISIYREGTEKDNTKYTVTEPLPF